MKLNNDVIQNVKNKFQSVRVKLFFTLCTTVIIIIILLLIINNVVLETYYLYSKQAVLLKAYKVINNYYNSRSNKQ